MPIGGKTAQSAMKFGVVDLFAGPGGLAEGFSAVTDSKGHFPFKIELSVEKEPAAHSTLLLRSFLRQFGRKFPEEYYTFLRQGGVEPDWRKLYPVEWRAANREALQLELGNQESEPVLLARIKEVRQRYGDKTILIGGPPCQAYSLAGRVRNGGIAGYVPEDDPKHTLYENYIKILTQLRPAAFVMENVKGMLSSSLHESRIFGLVLKDLRSAGGGYQLVALAPRHTSQSDLIAGNIDPRDFIVRAEEFGLPQARHRVIVVGIRRDLIRKSQPLHVGQRMTSSDHRASVEDVLKGMPKLRSGVSHKDSPAVWAQTMRDAAAMVCKAVAVWPASERTLFRERINECADVPADMSKIWPRTASRPAKVGPRCARALSDWLLDPRLGVLPNNETRCHMPSDYARYMFASAYAEMSDVSPKASDFPEMLCPDHLNWNSGDFADRFRVQLWSRPSTTITSHISKDGHYFIHPDPEQCRSLTVREAARLQTFPDNYFFKGTRTQQFVQVGNAVPPFLASQIGDAILSLLQQIYASGELAHDKDTSTGTDMNLCHKSVAPSSLMRSELDRLSSAVGVG